MKGALSFRKIIYSSGFLAIIPAVIVMLFLPSLGTISRLQVDPVDKDQSKNVYADLNSDNISELIRTGKGYPYFFVIVMDNDLRVYDQWNFKDSLDPELSDFFFGNYDNDQ
jgi:hypothetical protein